MMQHRKLLFLGWLVLFGLLAAPAVTMAQVDTFATPGTFTYIVPANVTQITVELWGAGGGGGNSRTCTTRSMSGAGGGAGEYVSVTLNVTAGQIYQLVVGTPGTNSAAAGFTYFLKDNFIQFSAASGSAGFPIDTSCNTPQGGPGGRGGQGSSATHVAGNDGGQGIAGGAGSSVEGGGGGAGFKGFGGGGSGSSTIVTNGAQPGDAGRVVITTGSPNPPPGAANDSYSVAQDTVLFIPAPGVLSNDTISGGNALTAQLDTNPTNGILALNSNGSFFYTPNSGFVGIDTYTYKASGGTGTTASAPATVSITVTPSGTSAPSVKAQLVPAVIRVGDTVNIDMLLQNPFLAAGGGIDAVETKCAFTPTGILIGLSVTPSADLFKPDPAIINKGFTGDNFLYAVSQSGNNPLVKTNGRIFSLSLTAQKVGQATLNCTAKGIDGAGKEVTLPFVGVVVDVQNLVAGTGNIKGVVHFSHKPDGGATITLLNAAAATVGTATTQADGSFILTAIPVGSYTIRAESPGYLLAQGTVTVVSQQTVTKATVTLLAGDLVTTAPIVIDELDVVQLALNYGQAVPPAPIAADLNADKVVGLADLNALATNLRKTGPIAWN